MFGLPIQPAPAAIEPRWPTTRSRTSPRTATTPSSARHREQSRAAAHRQRGRSGPEPAGPTMAAVQLYGVHPVAPPSTTPREDAAAADHPQRHGPPCQCRLTARPFAAELVSPRASTACSAGRRAPGRQPRNRAAQARRLGARRRAGWCSCSTRSPIRTMSARSCARPSRSAPARWSRRARHSPLESGVLAKSASGALELIPDRGAEPRPRSANCRGGFQTIGLDCEGRRSIEKTFAGQLALVLGAEGKGLRQQTREL